MGKMKPFFIKGVSTYINPMQFSSLYRAGDNWHVVMANGSDYTLSDDEYTELILLLNKEPEPPHKEENPFGDMPKDEVERLLRIYKAMKDEGSKE